MSGTVSTLAEIELEGTRHLFIVINETQFETAVPKALRKALPVFGAAIGKKGRVITPYPIASAQLTQDILAKPWPDHIQEIIEAEEAPLLLIISMAFDQFDPGGHDWRIVRFGEAKSPEKTIPHFFESLSRGLERDQEVMVYLDGVRDERTGMAPFGQVLRPNDPLFGKVERMGGSLDPGWGLIQEITSVARDEGLDSTEKHQGDLVRKAIERLRRKNNFPFGWKGTANALNKGIWNKIDAALTE